MTASPSDNPYTAEFLANQRVRLAEERERVLEEISTDEDEFRSWSGDVDGGDAFLSDDATALAERQLEMSLIENARYVLGEIDHALKAMDDGSYGWDAKRQVWIRAERLAVLPWAREEVDRIPHGDEDDLD